MPFCKGGDIVKRGYRYNEYAKKQRWLCNLCGRSFVEDDGFWKMRHLPETIAEAIDLYEGGLSEETVAEHLWRHHAIQVSSKSVKNWVIKYGKLINKFAETTTPRIKGRIHEDEKEIKVKGRKTYFWRAIDQITNFKFPGPVGKRDMQNCMSLNRQIKKRCYKQMLEQWHTDKRIKFVTDKLAHYKTMHDKLFSKVTDLVHGVPIKLKKYGVKYNNNQIEREHTDVSLRIALMRSVKSTKLVGIVLNLKDNLDNFTKLRAKKSKTPAQLAGIELNLGRNKTLNLIKI